MKHVVLFTAAVILVVALSPSPAYGVCQKCNDNFTANAMCWTIGACEQGATMSSCVVKEVFKPDGSVSYRYCDAEGRTQGPECNGGDPSCNSTGGGGGGTDPTRGKGYLLICAAEPWGTCDPQCDLCMPFNCIFC